MGGFVEAVVGEGAVDFGGDGVKAVEDPAGFERGVLGEGPGLGALVVGRGLDGDLVAGVAGLVEVHEEEAGGVPDLVGEGSVAFGAGFAEGYVCARGGHAGQGEADGVGSEALDDVDGVDDVALGLGHLLAVGVADEAVDVDVFEGDCIGKLALAAVGHGDVEGEVAAQHDHAGYPEEEDVEAGDEESGWVEVGEVGC